MLLSSSSSRPPAPPFFLLLTLIPTAVKKEVQILSNALGVLYFACLVSLFIDSDYMFLWFEVREEGEKLYLSEETEEE